MSIRHSQDGVFIWIKLALCTGAGAGVFPYFAGAGAGAGVCSPPAKLRQHLFVLQTSIIDQRKN